MTPIARHHGHMHNKRRTPETRSRGPERRTHLVGELAHASPPKLLHNPRVGRRVARRTRHCHRRGALGGTGGCEGPGRSRTSRGRWQEGCRRWAAKAQRSRRAGEGPWWDGERGLRGNEEKIKINEWMKHGVSRLASLRVWTGPRGKDSEGPGPCSRMSKEVQKSGRARKNQAY